MSDSAANPGASGASSSGHSSGSSGNDGGASNAMILSVVTEMKTDVSNLRNEFTSFRNNLPEGFMPRREAEGLFRELRDITSDLRTHMTAMEEWRLSETRKAASDQMTLQAQIQAANVTALKDNATAQVSATQQIASTRAALDERTIGILQALAFMVISLVLAFILAHLGIVH